MNTKLTLNINQEIIEEAKSYAKSNKMSLSKIIENYLHSLTIKNSKSNKVSPLVESLTGVVSFDEGDFKTSYSDYLSEKYS